MLFFIALTGLMLPISSQAASTTILADNFGGVPVTFPDGTKKLYPDPQKWAFTFFPGMKWPGSYGDGTNWLNGNDECQTYVTPFLTQIKKKPIPVRLRYDPFEIKEDGLHIRASLLNKEQQTAYQVEAPYRRFGSGVLLSRKTFTYGQIRLVAKLPSAKGSWPAFWLLPAVFQWPPEIDIFEGMAWGHHSQEFHAGIIPTKAEGQPKGDWYNVGVDLSQDFHEYGLNWTPTTITGLFDGKEIWSEPTPPSMKHDMYVVINLAVGGKWAFNELKIKPIDDRSPARLERGSDAIASDYPAELIIKSLKIEKLK